MTNTRTVAVADLSLDLANYRTVHQDSEPDAVRAMVSTSPDRFWALVESLLDDGYMPIENIVVLDERDDDSSLTVKEGNRRIAAVKLILGELDDSIVDVPENLRERIASLDGAWRTSNSEVPCIVYGSADRKIVDRLVTRAHGKGEKAGRDQWNTIARARHNRDAQGQNEPALDLLEKYLKHGRNHTAVQAARWAGDYPLTVLEEAMKRLSSRLGFRNSAELAAAYPKVKGRDPLEQVIRAIGMKLLGFEIIRSREKDFGEQYGIPEVKPTPTPGGGAGGSTGNGAGQTGGAGNGAGSGTTGASGSTGGATNGGAGGSAGSGTGSGSGREEAISSRDPRSVKAKLRAFAPKGSDRDKVVTLRDEAHKLNLKNNPLAFCFVLRSMFEISAKAYCKENASKGGPSTTKKNGSEKYLVDVLRDIVQNLTQNKSDRAMMKALHGAMTELARQDGLLSVTSMNQLVHNPSFNVTTTDICILFGNVFPLLEAMNE